mmetsp:Transcript_42992/g.93397  ORF Transcript_42992/g.93397 Transcript_42992/m.93397 type:complete len:193 (+) Transcript_42992:2-580(+)
MNADAYEASKAGDARRLSDAVSRGIQNINAFNSRGHSCLHVVCSIGNTECADILLRDGGADPNAASPPGLETPLHTAALFQFPRVVQLLLSARANPNIQDERNATAIHLAAAGGSIEVLELLLAAGADPNIVDYKQRTAADVAKSYEKPAALSLLQARGQQPSQAVQQPIQAVQQPIRSPQPTRVHIVYCGG